MSRENAKRTLCHYFRVALSQRGPWDGDNIAEISGVVDDILDESDRKIQALEKRIAALEGGKVAEPATPPKDRYADFRPSSFLIDAAQGPFKGFTNDETWNGFACPYFTYDQAWEVARALNGKFLPAKDVFVFPNEADGEPEEFGAVEINGTKYWPIGAHCWVWFEVLLDLGEEGGCI